MAKVRIFTPENRLRNVLSDTSGATAVELSTASETLVAGMAVGLLKRLQEDVARLTALRAGGDEALLSRSLDLSAIAMNIVEIAGAAGRPQLGEAARGILAMADGLASASLAHKEAMAVHIGAVLLLGAEPPPGQKEADSMLSQLADMRRFLGVME